MATLRVRGGAAGPATVECGLCAHHNPDGARFCCACGAALGEPAGAAPPRRGGLRIASTSDAPRALPAARWIGQAPVDQPRPDAEHPRTLAEMLERSAAASDIYRQLVVAPRGQSCDIPVDDATPPADMAAPAAEPPPLMAGEPPMPWAPPQRPGRRWRALLLVATLCAVVGVPATLAWRDMALVGAALTASRVVPPTPPALSAAGTGNATDGTAAARESQPPPQPAAPSTPQPPQTAAACAPQVAALGLCEAAAQGR